MKRDYKVISGGTDNHMMLIDLRNKNITGKDAEKVLELAAITANKNMVPFDTQSPFVTSGIRLGTAAITTRGLKEEDCSNIVNWIDQIVLNHDNDELLNSVRQEVNEYMTKFPLYS